MASREEILKKHTSKYLLTASDHISSTRLSKSTRYNSLTSSNSIIIFNDKLNPNLFRKRHAQKWSGLSWKSSKWSTGIPRYFISPWMWVTKANLLLKMHRSKPVQQTSKSLWPSGVLSEISNWWFEVLFQNRTFKWHSEHSNVIRTQFQSRFGALRPFYCVPLT